MRNSRQFTIQHNPIAVVLICVAGMLLCSAPLSAGIYNVTTGETLFYDDFEGLGTDVSHAAYPDTSDDYDPVASIGAWDVLESSVPEKIQVTDNIDDLDPGPCWGSNYLRIYRGESAASNATMTFQSTEGEHIRFEGWVNMPAYPENDALKHSLALYGGESEIRISLQLRPVLGIVYNYDGGWNELSELSIIPGTWQKYTLDYTIGETTYGFGIDETYVPNIPLRGGPGGLGRITFMADKGFVSPIYLDDGEGGSEELPGDLNEDGFVGGDDLDIVRSFWGQNVTAGDLLSGDPSGDGFVGGDDLDIVRANWGQGTPPAPTSIPEPAFVILVITAVLSLAFVRWFRH